MANASKIKGSRWERQVCDLLTESGVIAERIPAGANIDRGDLWIPNWTVECKDRAALSLGAWLDETLVEQINRLTPWHALTVKRRGHSSAAAGFAVMSMPQLASIMRALP